MKQKTRARLLAGWLAVAVAATLLGMVPTASAEPAPPPAGKQVTNDVPAGVAARMRVERPYLDAATKILDVVESSGGSGFSGVELAGKTLRVWWKGQVPATVGRAVRAAQQSVPVTMKPARYSRHELEKSAARLDVAMKADPKTQLSAVQIPVDGSRLIATFDKETSRALVRPDKTTLRTSRGSSGRTVSFPKAGGVAIQVIESERVEPACGPPTRYNDGWAGSTCTGSTFSGGGAIINGDNGARCTAGFGVRNASGQRFLLTAGHCGRPGGGWQNGNRSRSIGNGTAENVGHDLLLVSASSDSFMWDGGAQSSWGKTVSGWRDAIPGVTVCQSGSTSGAQCGILNSRNFTYSYCGRDAYGNNECYNDLVYSTRSNGTAPCAGGDSGGPVFVLNGTSAVLAVGTVSGCSSTVMVYQDFRTANRDFGVVTVNNG